jgi:hypothetical protein
VVQIFDRTIFAEGLATARAGVGWCPRLFGAQAVGLIYHLILWTGDIREPQVLKRKPDPLRGG